MSESPIEILLVEDNPNDMALALRALRRYQPASRIQVVRDGVEALEFLFCTGAYAQRKGAVAPRLILLDLKLPLIDGLEVLRQIKADPRTQPLPVVMLSSSCEERDVSEGYRLGVNSYIVKPVDFDQFSEAIGRLAMYWLSCNQPPPILDSRQHGAGTR